MDAEEIIGSGKLELYVTGSLPANEMAEVERAIADHPEVKEEVEQIEAALLTLSRYAAPTLPAMVWTRILNAINGNSKTSTPTAKLINWPAITGWAAAILFIGGIFWLLKKNHDLSDSLRVTSTENSVIKGEKEELENKLANVDQILQIVRGKDYQAYTLPGNQAVAPQAFAKVYLNKKEKVAYIDAQGLPPAPKGKVYQVWSLTMEPLVPSSMGLISPQAQTQEDLYKFSDFAPAEAFGITLEPEGGSETPTLSQLYVLGVIPAS